MRDVRVRLTLWLLPIALLALPGVVTAAPPSPEIPPHPPLPQVAAPIASQAPLLIPGALSQSLPPLKAVLLVGPIDGDNGIWTAREKNNMELAAVELETNGVTVYRFYAPDNDWEQIKAAANGAHFLLYRGHGVYWSPMPSPTVGGFALSGRFVSPDQIRNELRLAPNAIVMLYGCFTAGSSSIDGGSISSAEAQRRVLQYSAPFMDIQAAGYYANWFGDAFQMYVRYLFRGMTLGDAYQAYFDFNPASVERYSYPAHTGSVLWLDKDTWGGQTQYNNAFAGQADKTLMDLFAPPQLVSPDEIWLLALRNSPPRTFTIQINSPGPASWSVNLAPSDASWLIIQPWSGPAGQPITVQIDPQGRSVGTYQASLHIVSIDTLGATSQDVVPITLQIVEDIHRILLPVVIR